MPDYLPRKDTDLRQWTANLSAQISANPGVLGLSPLQALDYAASVADFAAALGLATDPGTRTCGTVASKDAARRATVEMTRILVRIIRAVPGISESQLLDLGFSARSAGSPVHPPQTQPVLTLLPTVGRIVRVSLRNAGAGTVRGKPADVAGALVFYCLGPDQPADVAEWTFAGSTSRTTFEFTPPSHIAAGTQLSLLAMWINTKTERGPASLPITTHVQFGVVRPMAA